MVGIVKIDVSLVRHLIATQFPQWAQLPIQRVEPNGWDNRTFRLGPEMSVRLPSHERYAAQVEKEQRWLPRLSPVLPLSVPTPLARGTPGHGYPWHWCVYRWIPGETANVGRIGDLAEFASDLAGFLRSLHRVDSGGGPRPGQHNFFRGGPLEVYDHEVRRAVQVLGDRIDRGAVVEAWEAALGSTWRREPVWLHGDLVTTNLLVDGGRLSAVIDFGCSGVGDPSCDLAITWLLFSGRSRAVFREHLELDPSTWVRGRGWTLWKRLVRLEHDPQDEKATRVVDAILAEHKAEG